MAIPLGAPSAKPYKIDTLKTKLMRPALTSHYICEFNPAGLGLLQEKGVDKWLAERARSGFSGEDYNNREIQELIQISCCDASLPGSSLMTNDINDDYHGVSQKHAYRRLYDDRADFTFYVDNNYTIISFFEGWMAYIVGESYNGGELYRDNYSYRVNFPVLYKTDTLYIKKFERDIGNVRVLTYQFKNAYPISITSMPVNYDQSQLLKCTVSFTYERYILTKVGEYIAPTEEPAAQTLPGIPESRIVEGTNNNEQGIINYSFLPNAQSSNPRGAAALLDNNGFGSGIRNANLTENFPYFVR